MKKIVNFLVIFLSIFTFIYSFFNMPTIFITTSSSINLVLNQIIPTLLPFMLITYILTHTGIVFLISYFLQWVLYPLFKLSGTSSYIFTLSMVSGYPGFAKLIQDNYDRQFINQHEANRLMCISSFGSISFIIMTLGHNFLHNQSLAYLLVLCHFIPNFVFAFATRSYHKDMSMISLKTAKKNFARVFKEVKLIRLLKSSIYNVFSSLIYISGFIIIFNILVAAISTVIPDLHTNILIHSLFEFSNGTIRLASSFLPTLYQIPFLAFFISFSGICVFLQVLNTIDHIPVSYPLFFVFRLLQASLSYILCFMILKESYLFIAFVLLIYFCLSKLIYGLYLQKK